jgi:hypothetical protein
MFGISELPVTFTIAYIYILGIPNTLRLICNRSPNTDRVRVERMKSLDPLFEKTSIPEDKDLSWAFSDTTIHWRKEPALKAGDLSSSEVTNSHAEDQITVDELSDRFPIGMTLR